MEDLLKTQGQLAEAIEKLYINFKKDGAERKTPQLIKRRLDTLEQYWMEFRTNDIKLNEYDNKDFVYFTGNHFDRISGVYTEARRAIQQYIPTNQEDKPIVRPATPMFSLNTDWSSDEQPTPMASTSAEASSRPPSIQQTTERGNQSRLEEMYRKQQSHFKAFQRAVNNIYLESLTEKWEFEDAIKTVQSRWAAVDSLHWEIDSEQLGGRPGYEESYNQCEKKYNDIKRLINSKMWDSTHRERSTPAMEIPTFSGSYHQWTSFKDLFLETIHKNNSISKAQKMQFLKSKVKGEAEKIIQHLNISTENYQVCWDILNHRYNNTRLIFSSHINTLLSLPTMQQQAALPIKKLHDTTKECLHAIENLGVNTSSWDPLIVHLLAQKLDADSHNDYIEHLEEPRELPTLQGFLKFLEAKFTALEAFRRKQELAKPAQSYQERKTYYPRTSPNHQPFNHYYKENKNYQAQHNKNYHSSPIKNYQAFATKMYTCSYCNLEHDLFRCNKFLGMTPETKLATVTSHNICKNCLYKHYGNPCTSEKRCKQCNGEHNTILHEAFVIKNKNAATGQSVGKNIGHVSQDDEAETLLSTAQIKVLSSDGSYIILRALIDQGSQISLITENAAQRLGLPRQNYKGSVFGIGSKENNCKGVISITAASLHSEYTFNTKVFIMNRLINNLPNRSFSKPSWSHLEGIQLADPEFHISRPIDILFGADIYSNIILNSIIRENDSVPIAQQSRLGWILCGNMKSYHCNVVVHNLEDISRFWEIEDINETSRELSSEDQYCINQFKTETTRREDGRYVVRLPLKPDIKEKLGESKQKAVAQFYQLEKKFQKDEKTAKEYKSFINEYLELGHMRPCESNTTPNNYLPHHCVHRAESTTTALRVVYNASSPTSSGYSLNDMMYRGPNYQSDLLSLILKWRQYKIAFTADIEKMFRQIMCHEQDQLYQKIIWRDYPNQPLREYALTTVTYGTKAAPFLAMMTLKQLAMDESHRYPEVAEILKQDFYMDDLLSGSHSIESAKQIQHDLISLLKKGGFNLRKWCSNNSELLEEMSNTDNNQQSFDFKHQESKKTLGLRWDPQEDEFTFQLKIDIPTSQKITKRSLLSNISKVFDPLGWICPTTTKLKLLFQSTWKQNLEWDDQVPQETENEWRQITENLHDIDDIKVPRWLKNNENDNIELHAFCDASEKAYACIIYCKVLNKNEGEDQISPKITIVAAKSKLVPAKKCISLPRLELCGALLLSKLLKKVSENLSNKNIKVFCWTDSTAVLGWLQGDVNRWKTFVSNRVTKIKETISPESWRYVKSAENPADCASRGISASQLKENTLWWEGPTWLPNYEAKPQEATYITEQDIKTSKQSNVTTLQQNNDVIKYLLNKHSNINRLTRVLAWVLRAISRNKKGEPYITLPELRKARNLLITHVQQESFGEEIISIKKGGHVNSKSSILSLNPFLDKDGLLRVNGRIRNANLDPNMKHPIIIPHEGHMTNLLIENAHRITHHGGARLTLRQLKYKFWIIGGNRAVKKHIKRCIKCVKLKALKQDQIMGDLPAARCNPTRPFYHTGVDYTGYVDIKSNKGRGVKTTKGYIAVFVCMATKAVHLELVSDLSSSAFLAALRRLSARRGTPGHMYSDNGTNFVGASRRLNQDFINMKNTLDNEFFTTISEMEIKWHFNAPSWPSAGGIWESAVKSLKHHLRRVIGEQKLTYEEYSTLLTQVEACMNSRPLCAITEDPDDLDFLTPSHFLSSGPNLTIFETEKDLRTRWQLVQKIVSDVWKRWQSEYLCQLSTRSKWQQPRENMKVGDVVVIHDANLPIGKWALGGVTELHPGRDGYVRVVSLKSKGGFMKRPITKLSKLPVDQEDISKMEPERPATQSLKQDNEKSKPQRKSKRSCNFITLALMLFFALISSSQCEHILSKLNEQQGMYFDKVSTMHLIRDQWKLIVYYDMGPYWKGQQLLKSYISTLENMCSKATKPSQCDVVVIQLRHSFAELEYYNSIMLGQQAARSTRRRRGIINGVGYLANTLFGTLDEHFAQQYEKDIKLIRNNEKHLALLWKNQTSIIEAEYNVLKRVEESMNKQHAILDKQVIDLEKATNILQREILVVEYDSKFMLTSIIANTILVSLKSIQETLLETITNVHHGKFNIHLLTPAQLKDELNIISGQLSKELTIPINNIQTDLQSIYQLLKVKARMTSNYLIFEIKIPLASRDNFEIYNVIAIPRQVEQNMISISPIAEHLAINIQKDSFVPLSLNELEHCIPYDMTTHLCPLEKPIYHMKADDSLCVKDTNINRTSQCKIINVPCADIWYQMKKPNTYLFFCCGQRTIRIICESQVTAERINGAGIITLEEGCVIKGEAFTIFTHKQNVNNMNIQPDLVKIEVPPINNIINLSIPTQKDKLSNNTSDFKGDFLKLDQQIKNMKENEMEGVLADRISTHDVHQFALIYIILAAAILCGIIYLWRHWRLRCYSPRTSLAAPSDRSTSQSVQDLTRNDKPDKSLSKVIYTKKERSSTNAEFHEPTARVLDRATSPIIGERFASDEHYSVV